MKTMLWMRHGKSDWDTSYGADHERPLSKRGVEAARTMGAAISRAGLAPDRVLSSTAVRARTTAELAMEGGGWSAPVRHERGLYEGPASRVLELVRQTDDGADILLVAGHEPTWSSAVSLLVGGGEVRMVTAAVACVTCDVPTWSSVREGRGQLLWLLPPKLLAKLLSRSK